MATLEEQVQDKTAIDIDNQSRKIWEYVRNNQHSLDSERACKMITSLCEIAAKSAKAKVRDLVVDLRRLAGEIVSLKKELRETRKAVSAASKENDYLQTEYDVLLDKNEQLSDELETIKSKPAKKKNGNQEINQEIIK